ncbi:unnamed protein product [Hermetia illucens]|uniref:Uncharacterized protein n=2 Tax=Hermetia illucens TaxID=343691 RepID=A0A7R8ULT2_HERIL|nr:unnamed protein product [Hermetia illucens]
MKITNTYQIRNLHDGKAEIFGRTANESVNFLRNNHVHNNDMVNMKKFFSGTSQGGEESASQKVNRLGFKVLAKSLNVFETIRTSNEVSVLKAGGRKIWHLASNAFRKNVAENERVVAMKNDFKQKLDQAREEEKRN